MAAATVLTTRVANPAGYGRVLRGPGGFQAIVEDRDATDQQKTIPEINAGLYCVVAPNPITRTQDHSHAHLVVDSLADVSLVDIDRLMVAS